MNDFWVFGYGSLMWNPGFAYLEAVPSCMYGLHRSLCIYSHVHRGTPEQPGLVLGLDKGGSCHGMGFRVSNDHKKQVVDYLRARELVTNVYLEKWRQMKLLTTKQSVSALCYIVDQSHLQYAAGLDAASQAELVRKGEGKSGHNIDYLKSTLEHLENMGIKDNFLLSVQKHL